MEDKMKAIIKTVAVLSASVVAATGCVAVPVNHEGVVTWEPVPAPLVPHIMASQPVPTSLPARLYPTNDIARATGTLSGSVTNLMNGKGRFHLNYRGQTLVGEATRDTEGDAHSGIANAASAQGTYMNCRYRMNHPRQGSGTCTFSDGAHYDVHLGG
jgi:hypothetical protein